MALPEIVTHILEALYGKKADAELKHRREAGSGLGLAGEQETFKVGKV